jgi:uncharacterized protein (TIGR00369 family)
MAESMSDAPKPFDRERVLPLLDAGFRKMVPHNDALGVRVIDAAPGACTMVLPWAEHLVGNPETGVLHGGAITSFLDACCGASVFLKTQSPIPIATLDLRIDYLKPATPRRDVLARADCYKLGRNVAFVRALAYHDTEDDPIAAASATFMLATKGQPVVQRPRA